MLYLIEEISVMAGGCREDQATNTRQSTARVAATVMPTIHCNMEN